MENNTIKTDERIFKVLTFDDDYILCNLDKAQELINKGDIKKAWHIWNFEFETISKLHIKNMNNK